ncbi:uncharacterized protein LOC100890564 [Strongylocentrotus purpuratus]|uniref:Uncharacterized protein n=1 Tax=Strongylocentrotus purpuratus TaxID=7668 RepID=A0A7M7GMP8_STRPU|nr:uncharacterized protein LOC100890564 [Strongylocentrotus purpuratus]|eukprot:XP_003730168.1 PREDICTED: uncharacterized protein LOC100890564 [Strongylocentrotus purpuratus]
MASSGKLICFFALIAACCLVTEARRSGKTREVRHVVGAPQKQTMFDFPFDQTVVGGSAAAGSVGASTSVFGSDSESSEESDLDMDMDTDINEVDAADTPAMVGGNGNQVGGNLLPFLSGGRAGGRAAAPEAGNADQLLSRTSGSSGRGVGIAFAVMGLLTVIVAAAAFTLRKYRHSIPVLVRV